MTAGELTLGDLLGQDDLGLKLRVGQDQDLQRGVDGVHSIEIQRPGSWLAPGWVMLTTGVSLVDDVEGQRALVAELARSGMTALGFATQMIFDDVPPAILEVAREIGFPVFAVPLQTPFREIVTRAERIRVSAELRRTQRCEAVQRQMLSALQEAEPRMRVLLTLGRAVGAKVGIVSARRLEVTGAMPVDAVRRWLDGAVPTFHTTNAGGVGLAALPIGVDQCDSQEWLVAAAARPDLITDPFNRMVMAAAAPILKATEHLDRGLLLQELSTRAGLLDEVLTDESPTGNPALSARGQLLGITATSPLWSVVLAGGTDGPPLQLLLAARSAFGRRPHLLRHHDGVVEVVVEADQDVLTRAIADLRLGWPGARVGIGRPMTDLRECRTGRADALRALSLTSGTGSGRDVCWFHELDLTSTVLCEVRAEQVALKVEGLLGDLRRNPPLMEALEAYFANELNAVAAAEALCLHPNSLRYRLHRVEEHLGRSLRQPATIADLYLALQLDRAAKPELRARAS